MPNTPRDQVAHQIKQLWEKHNFSARGLSLATGIARETIRSYGSGARLPSDTNLEKIRNALNLPIDGKDWVSLTSAVHTARDYRPSARKRTTTYLPTHDTTNALLVEGLIDLFYMHANRDRDETLTAALRAEYQHLINTRGK